MLPGEVVIGADSHSLYARCIRGICDRSRSDGYGSNLANRGDWFRVPESIGIHLTGSFIGAAEAKDLALTYVSKLGMDGGTYRALEFIGEATPRLSMDERLVLCNLAVETGAKAGTFYADTVTVNYLAALGQKVEKQVPKPCNYCEELTIDLSDIVPQGSAPAACRYDKTRI